MNLNFPYKHVPTFTRQNHSEMHDTKQFYGSDPSYASTIQKQKPRQ